MDTYFASESETHVIHRNRFPYLFRGIKSLAPGQYPHGPPSTYHIYQHYRVTATACLFFVCLSRPKRFSAWKPSTRDKSRGTYVPPVSYLCYRHLPCQLQNYFLPPDISSIAFQSYRRPWKFFNFPQTPISAPSLFKRCLGFWLVCITSI